MSRRIAAALAPLFLLSCATLNSVTGGRIPADASEMVNADNAERLARAAPKAVEGAKNLLIKCTDEEAARFELTAENEYWFGRSVANRLLASYLGPNKPAAVYEPDDPAVVYLNKVGQAVALGALRERDESPRGSHPRVSAVPDRPLPVRGYHFILVHDAAPNAWGLPGGFLIVSDGLVKRAATEDQLAGVLAHELAHGQRGHGMELVKHEACNAKKTAEGKQQLSDAAATAGLSGVPLGELVKLLADTSQKFLGNLGSYAAEYEFEADAYGTRYLRSSGYSALALADLLRRNQNDRAFAGDPSKTHAPPADRAQRIEALVRTEPLSPPRTPTEALRTERFNVAIGQGLRADGDSSNAPGRSVATSR